MLKCITTFSDLIYNSCVLVNDLLIGMLLVSRFGLVEEDAVEVFPCVCICFDGVVIAAQSTAIFLKIYCAPPNSGIRT